MTVPLDIKPTWFNPIRRLQSVAAKSNGLAIVSMKFLVNEKGDPVNWTEPSMTLIEPMRERQTILDLFAD